MTAPHILNPSPLALLIQDPSVDAGSIREAVAQDQKHPVRLQCVERLSTGLARIAGGGVDLVLLDISGAAASQDGLDNLLQLLRHAPQVPTVVVCGSEDEGLALKAMRAGATDYVMKDQLETGLSRVLHSVLELARNDLPLPAPKLPEQRLNQGIFAFLGAKGGVGTTTLALNIASVLARRSSVILVEMHPAFGTLAPYLQPHGLTRNLSHVLQTVSLEIGASLWSYKNVPGLSVLFGPQTADECVAEIDPEKAKAIIQSLARMADYVVLDLPPSLSPANRAAIECSSSMALVVERDPVCVQAARLMAQTIVSWNAAPQPLGAVVVNRAAVGSPMPLAEMNTLLACQLLGVIPPSADLCLSAQNAAAPIVAFHPDSLMAGSLNSLSEILAPTRSAAKIG